jgi:hypothetical protein
MISFINKSLFVILLVTYQSAFSQQYEGLEIEKNKVDDNNTVYTYGKEFVYSITIIKDGKRLYLSKNDLNDFKLTDDPDSLRISEVHLNVIKAGASKRTNKNQTEIYYSYEPNPKYISATGIVENENNVWLHPPRSGFFKSLETCPFPYIKLKKPIGYQWKDGMKIGEQWSNKMWGEWKGTLSLQYEYQLIGEEKIATKMGESYCIVIESKASTTIGTTKLKAHYSDQYGFVILYYTLSNGIEIILNLEKISARTVMSDEKDFFHHKN